MYTTTAGFVLNIMTLVFSIGTCILTFPIILMIFFNLIQNQIRRDERVTIILSATIYPLIFIYSSVLVSFNIQTLLGDLYQENFESTWCFFIGYFSPALLTMLYWTFVNQAIFRLCRVVYSTRRWLQHVWVYLTIFLVEIIFILLLVSPVLFWNDVIYLPEEHYCYVPFSNHRGILWLLFNTYGIPLIILVLIYIRVTKYLKQQPVRSMLPFLKQRQERDLLVIRRIFIIIAFLLTLGIPAVVLLIKFYITGQLHPLILRIEWLSVSISMIELSLFIVIFTPQLKTMISKIIRDRRIYPIAVITKRSTPTQPKDNGTTAADQQ